MLYHLWRNVAARQEKELALQDTATGKRWTFGQLFVEGENAGAGPDAIIFPQGHGPEFLFSLLSAWRTGKVTCPLEVGQRSPEMIGDPPDCVHLKLTSATTGSPRMIAFTAGQLAADAEHIVQAMGLRPEWPNLGVISLAHSYGFSNLVLPLLLHGIPLLLAPAPLPDLVRRASEAAGAITLPGVPALWRAWHEAGGIPAQVRLAISAGAPLPLELEQAIFGRSGTKIHNFYGASECGGIAYDGSAQPRASPAFVGNIMPAVDTSVNEEGCLTVRGPAVGQGYWPESLPALGNGSFQTTDLAEVADGKIMLRGRLTDVINIAGRKVSPETIEQAISTHPLVRECLVFGAPSGDERMEMIVALIAGSVVESELRQFLLERLPAWQLPRRWQFVESLPVGARGKISRAVLRREFKG